MNKYIFIVLLICPGVSLGCSVMCASIEEMYSSSDYVFLGKVIKVKETSINWFRSDGHEPSIEVYFDIERNWKGSWGNRPLETIQNKWSCWGGSFKENKRYIMFLHDKERLSLCGQQNYSKELVEKLDSISNVQK